MSPIADPRYAAARRERIEREKDDSRREGQLEYVRPLIMLAVGASAVMIWRLLDGPYLDEEGETVVAAWVVAALYSVQLAIQLAFGVVGLWLASKLWLGGVDYLGLATVRLAGIYAVTDFVGLLVSPLMILGWAINTVLYISLLMWLFELEAQESIILGIITWLLKVLAGFAIVLIMSSS